MRTGSLNTTVVVLAVAGSLVLLNILGLKLFGRVDLTRDQVYTLSKASREAVGSLEDPITVTAYITQDLPSQYASTGRYIRDLLQEYRSASKGKLSFEFIDPAEQESQEDKQTKREVKRDIFGQEFRDLTKVEKELAADGIQAVPVPIIEEDERGSKRIYLGVVLHYGEKKEVIPFIQNVGSLEYDLTSLIRKMSRAKKPVVALLQGHDEPKLEDKLSNLQMLLSQTYDVRPLDLSGKDKVDDDVDALWVVGPKTAFKPNELKAVDQFLMRGKAVAFFLDTVQVDLKTFQPTDAQHGLAPLLATYGITVTEKLVTDVQSATLSVQEQRGPMMVRMPLQYPFIPIIKRFEGDSPITKGLAGVTLPFSTSVEVKAPEGAVATTLAKSSSKSWLENKPFNLDPRRDWQQEQISFNGPHNLIVQVSGKLKSHFASEASTSPAAGGAPVLGESQAEARVIVAGGSTALWNDVMQMSQANQAFALNVADWLLLDPAMLAMRTRGLADAPLRQEIPSATRSLVKFGAAFGLPLLLALVGFLRHLMRESRRASVAV